MSIADRTARTVWQGSIGGGNGTITSGSGALGTLPVTWAARTEAPGGNLDFVRYPWVVSTEKLKSTADWQPRYDTLETFKITARAKGLMEHPHHEIHAPTAPVA